MPTQGEQQKLDAGLAALKAAVDDMKANNDPKASEAERAYDAAQQAKRGKEPPEFIGPPAPRLLMYKPRNPGVLATTAPEQRGGGRVRGGTGVCDGSEVVLVSEDYLDVGPPPAEDVGATLAHEGVRLTQEYDYPETGQSNADQKGIVDRTIACIELRLAIYANMIGRTAGATKEYLINQKKLWEERLQNWKELREKLQ